MAGYCNFCGVSYDAEAPSGATDEWTENCPVRDRHQGGAERQDD